MVALAPIVSVVALALDQFCPVLLIARERLLNYGERGVRWTNLFHLHLFALELFVVLEETFQYEQPMARQIPRFQIFAEFRIVGGDGDNFVVGGAGVHHGHNADGAGFDESQRLHSLLAEDQNIERIVVFGVGLRDEAIVRRIKNGRVNDAVNFKQPGGLVQFVFDVGAERNFNDRPKIARNILTGGNVMPSVNHSHSPRESTLKEALSPELRPLTSDRRLRSERRKSGDQRPVTTEQRWTTAESSS